MAVEERFIDNENAVLKDRYGQRIDECTFIIRPRVYESDRLMIKSNWGFLQNIGQQVLIIDDCLTIMPGGTFNWGSQHNPSITVKQLHVSFQLNPNIVDPNQTKIVEWVEFLYNGMEQIFYKSRGQQNAD